MSRRLALAAPPILAALVLLPAPLATAQGTGPCTHQGRQVQCPPGLPSGSQSVAFVPGGTNWRNSATGAIVFVPSTTFPPFVASPTPTAPPGPTTAPGPGQPGGQPTPTGSGPLFPLTADGFLVLTLPVDPSASRTIENPYAYAPLYLQERAPFGDFGLPSRLPPEDDRESQIYLQDRVRFGDYFSLNLGVRADAFREPREGSRPFGFEDMVAGPRPGQARDPSLVDQADIDHAPPLFSPGDSGAVDEVM